tara:strand:+ start:239 stop:799 length:561 start_codon:yes stop_codon:yes gene_type:complete
MKKINIIDTPRLFLRPMSERDTNLIVSWRKVLANEKNSAFINDNKNLTFEKQLFWFKNGRHNRMDYIFCEKINEKPIGSVHFKNINKFEGEAEAGKMIGEIKQKKKGFAKEAFGFWLKYGFEKLEFKKIYILTNKKNTININLNLGLGFKILEVKKKLIIKGEEFIKMEILKKDIYKIKNALNISL